MTTVFVSHPTDKVDTYFGAKAAAALHAIADVRFNPSADDLAGDALIDALQGCDALIAYRQTPGDARLFRGCADLVVFLRCAVDIRSVDVAAASEHGVLVTQASPGYGPAVVEWIVAAMIDLGRGMSRYAAANWRGAPLAPFMGRELRGATLGIVGHGHIGGRLGEVARALGMTLVVAGPAPIAAAPGSAWPAPPRLPLPELLARADIVVCLAPANPQTEKLFDAAAFAAMKPGAFFINAARGELVDDAALLQALDGGRLAGAALDVGRAPDQMPTPELARHPRVLATPHIGGLTLPAVEHQALETVDQLARLLRGEMPAGAVNAAHATRLARWGHALPPAADG